MDVAKFGKKSSPAIINRQYDVDYCDSVDTVEEAAARAKQVGYAHKQPGFENRNSPEVLTALCEEKLMSPVLLNEDKQTLNKRVLGMRRDPKMDELAIAVMHREDQIEYLKEGTRRTKRILLSRLMGFFDPLDLQSPFTLHRKIIQQLWRTGCRSDQEIDDDWTRWVPAKENLVNILTRWGPGPPLQNESEWRNGRSILFELDDHDSWRQQIEETSEEARGVVLFHETVNVEAFSTWAKLVRVTAMALRVVANCRRKKDGRPILRRLAELVHTQYGSEIQPLRQGEPRKAEGISWKQAGFL